MQVVLFEGDGSGGYGVLVVAVDEVGGGGHVTCSWYGPHPPWGRPRPSGPGRRSERQSDNGCGRGTAGDDNVVVL